MTGDIRAAVRAPSTTFRCCRGPPQPRCIRCHDRVSDSRAISQRTQSGLPSQHRSADQVRQQVFGPWSGKVRIGTSAVTNGEGADHPTGTAWPEQFFQACSHCPVDFVAFHWYGGPNLDAFRQHIDTVAQVASRHGMTESWLTEFGVSGDADAYASFISAATRELECHDRSLCGIHGLRRYPSNRGRVERCRLGLCRLGTRFLPPPPGETPWVAICPDNLTEFSGLLRDRRPELTICVRQLDWGNDDIGQ